MLWKIDKLYPLSNIDNSPPRNRIAANRFTTLNRNTLIINHQIITKPLKFKNYFTIEISSVDEVTG